jgi:putative ATP-dependent endonuclease of OLD family
LLTVLDIPFVTLLDLDLGRHQGGWGRVRYATKKLLEFSPATCGLTQQQIDSLPTWNSSTKLLENEPTLHWLEFLERKGIFFASPLDLDFAMLSSFPATYGVATTDQIIPSENKIKAVLGDSYHGIDQYTELQQKLFITYHKLFKLGSKPTAHLDALACLGDTDLVANMPASLSRLADAVSAKLEELPE